MAVVTMAEVTLRCRHFLKLLDFSTGEIAYLLELAAQLKALEKSGKEQSATVLLCCLPRLRLVPVVLLEWPVLTGAQGWPVPAD